MLANIVAVLFLVLLENVTESQMQFLYYGMPMNLSRFANYICILCGELVKQSLDTFSLLMLKHNEIYFLILCKLQSLEFVWLLNSLADQSYTDIICGWSLSMTSLTLLCPGIHKYNSTNSAVH